MPFQKKWHMILIAVESMPTKALLVTITSANDRVTFARHEEFWLRPRLMSVERIRSRARYYSQSRLLNDPPANGGTRKAPPNAGYRSAKFTTTSGKETLISWRCPSVGGMFVTHLDRAWASSAPKAQSSIPCSCRQQPRLEESKRQPGYKLGMFCAPFQELSVTW